MRTSEERITELHNRMDTLKKARIRRSKIISEAAVGFSLFITVALAILISFAPVPETVPSINGISASIFANHSALGYVLVALMAFCLGALVTVFCFRLRKHREEKHDDRKL